ncbi:hypothetical protein ON010_g66 [Phytophthora cinnamomi]|nr:hypothetical protein ON010_g66 [Phytophthora cinnamomi]
MFSPSVMLGDALSETQRLRNRCALHVYFSLWPNVTTTEWTFSMTTWFAAMLYRCRVAVRGPHPLPVQHRADRAEHPVYDQVPPAGGSAQR